jgi:RNA polymerase sigma-70 factor, ECF subfamily
MTQPRHTARLTLRHARLTDMALPQLDDEIIRKAQHGDVNAFARIVRTYETPVFNHVLRIVGDRALAEDLAQEVFVRVYQNLPRFSFRSRFTTWLFQVTVNRAVDEMRAQERRPRAIDLDDAAETLHTVDPPPEEAETIAAIWRAVGELDVDLKNALLLRDVAGLSYLEIADALGITLATVKWRIHRARADVALDLAEHGIRVAA